MCGSRGTPPEQRSIVGQEAVRADISAKDTDTIDLCVSGWVYEALGEFGPVEQRCIDADRGGTVPAVYGGISLS